MQGHNMSSICSWFWKGLLIFRNGLLIFWEGLLIGRKCRWQTWLLHPPVEKMSFGTATGLPHNARYVT